MNDPLKTTDDSPLPPCGTYGSNYAMFRWSGSEWLLIQNCCSYGFGPMPPDGRGEYDDETVVTVCVPMEWQAKYA